MSWPWKIGAALAAGGTVVLDLVAHDPSHAGAWWHGVPGFDLVYGFIGCAAIVLLSKALGKTGVQQREGFYDEDDG